MKTLIFIFLIFCASPLSSQPPTCVAKTVTLLLIEETNGYLGGSTVVFGDNKMFLVRTPAYYNFDLVRLSLRIILQQHPEMYTMTPWTRRDHNTFYTIIGIEHTQVLILYEVQDRALGVVEFIPTPENL